MSLFSTPLSGLNASSSALQAISNNLANLNTNGYKAQNAVFSDVFYQNLGTSGNADPVQLGFGVRVEGMSSNLTNGPVTSTGIDSNIALNGAGYFVTSNKEGALSYTRAGDFTTNINGQLTSLSGNLVMGFPAVGGVVTTNASLQPINVGTGTTTSATPTTKFSFTTNLNASSAVGDTYSPPPINVFDSLGQAHLLSVSYTKTGTNAWSYNVTVPSSDLQGGTGTTTSVGSGTLTFNTDGSLASPTAPVSSISIGPFADGAATMNPVWNLSSTANGPLISQTATANSTSANSQNGYAAGTLSGFSVLQDGTVQASFTNGQQRAIGQVAVASFANPEGLSLSGGNQYLPTAASGQAVIGVAGTGGLGTMVGAHVEQSNVDVATELSDLIVAQRSYEANAKAITAFDQVEQTTIQMKTYPSAAPGSATSRAPALLLRDRFSPSSHLGRTSADVRQSGRRRHHRTGRLYREIGKSLPQRG